MASEASRSSSSADSYIGSLISLISKSEIRYEGVLFNVNTAESSIGLKNVRSFGTEGRKKDGPQVPPSDKVYEYILFRGTDIKDLQVKSSPPAHTVAPIYNDPAIIQSHYPQVTATSTSLPSTVSGSLSSHPSPVGPPKSTIQSSLPIYQPSSSSGSWGINNSRFNNMPMYMHGFYGPITGIQAQQQSLLQPPLALSSSMPTSLHQTVQYPTINTPLQNMSTLPSQSSSVGVVDSSTTTMSFTVPTQAVSTSTISTSTPFVFPLATVSEKSLVEEPNKLKTVSGSAVSGSAVSYNSGMEPDTSFVGASSSFGNKGLTSAPSLVTPNQLMKQSGLSATSTSPSSSQQVVEVVVQIPSSEQQPRPTEAQAPILPTPSSSDCKVGGNHPHTRHTNRGGRERARGTGNSSHVTRFAEDFDFNAMNEKFNKDEVWGHFGKNNVTRGSGHDDSQDEDSAGTSKVEIKPVYVKDDFFDSLSSNAFDNGQRNRRTKFSEQRKVDVETFGNFVRHHGGRGGRVFGHGGRGFMRGARGYGRGGGGGHVRGGAYHGRSYYNGRGWGHHAT